jgi:large subunit ribosomal protein L21
LLIGNGKESTIGAPYVSGAKVIGKFVDTAADSLVKGPKLYPAWHRRRKNSKKRIGHRQKYLQVTIDKIEA